MRADEFVFGLKIFTSSFPLISLMPAEKQLKSAKNPLICGNNLTHAFPLISPILAEKQIINLRKSLESAGTTLLTLSR
ncbi:hypothetical protein E3V97_19920 [Pedobacter alluvionis]|nr:hypothetical protein [Pedobacter alluvionis]TFB29316.1 hypothetical protein E3V97_19920 [Pedobacter alluvionis]